jgi:hypothetical protein
LSLTGCVQEKNATLSQFLQFILYSTFLFKLSTEKVLYILTHNEQRRRDYSPQSTVKWHSVSFGGILMSTKRTLLILPEPSISAIMAIFAMVCGLNCILFTITFLDMLSGFISHY